MYQKKYGYPETVIRSWYKNLTKEVIDIVKKFVEISLTEDFHFLYKV